MPHLGLIYSSQKRSHFGLICRDKSTRTSASENGLANLSFILTSQFSLRKFTPAIFLLNPNYSNLEANNPDVTSQIGRKQRFLPTLGSICY